MRAATKLRLTSSAKDFFIAKGNSISLYSKVLQVMHWLEVGKSTKSIYVGVRTEPPCPANWIGENESIPLSVITDHVEIHGIS